MGSLLFSFTILTPKAGLGGRKDIRPVRSPFY